MTANPLASSCARTRSVIGRRSYRAGPEPVRRGTFWATNTGLGLIVVVRGGHHIEAVVRLGQVIGAEEMPPFQQTYTPFAAETRPTFRGTPDKSPQR